MQKINFKRFVDQAFFVSAIQSQRLDERFSVRCIQGQLRSLLRSVFQPTSREPLISKLTAARMQMFVGT